MTGDAEVPDAATAAYALGLGDDALILAQRLTEWVAAAPELESDIALANVALDLLGQARSLLSYAGTATGLSEDQLAYWREPEAFRCVWLVAQPNGDFGATIARQLVFSVHRHLLLESLAASTDATLAAIAAKGVKELAYHHDHAAGWVVRLGDGTQESHRRMQAGLEEVWPYVDELFAAPDAELVARGVAVDPRTFAPRWRDEVDAVLAQATLTLPDAGPAETGGRHGSPSPHLPAALAELQVLARAHPDATW